MKTSGGGAACPLTSDAIYTLYLLHHLSTLSKADNKIVDPLRRMLNGVVKKGKQKKNDLR